MIAKRPKMIHISCHGDYDRKHQEFYLKFEEYGNGISDKFHTERMKGLLKNNHKKGI